MRDSGPHLIRPSFLAWDEFSEAADDLPQRSRLFLVLTHQEDSTPRTAGSHFFSPEKKPEFVFLASIYTGYCESHKALYNSALVTEPLKSELGFYTSTL